MRIETTLSKNYVSHWTLNEALRELYQNAIDRENQDSEAKMINDVDIVEGKVNLYIGNKNTKLDISTILMGISDKGENALGQFGEGYKLALLVLLREGYTVSVHTNNQTWLPTIEHSHTFKDQEVLVFYTEDNEDKLNQTVFFISDIEKEKLEEYKKQNLYLQNSYEYMAVNNGQLLFDKKNQGKIFIGGLYICDYHNKTLHGYNFNPGVLPIGRDRRVVDGFDATWQASRALADAATRNAEVRQTALSQSEEAAQFISSHVIKYSLLVDAVWNTFIEDYPESIPYQYQSTADELIKKYKKVKCVQVADKVYQILIKSKGYEKAIEKLEEKPPAKAPIEVLNDFYNHWSADFTEKMEIDFGKVLIEAIDWTIDT